MSLGAGPKPRTSPWELAVAPPPERWDDRVELDPAAGPEGREKHHALVPTIGFNGESARGRVACSRRGALVLVALASRVAGSAPTEWWKSASRPAPAPGAFRLLNLRPEVILRESGRREPVLSLAPSDPSGVVAIITPYVSDDRKSCAYTASRRASKRFVSEGAR